LSVKAAYDALTKEEQKKTAKPVCEALMIQDVTIEAVQEILAASPNGVLCFQDELGGWFGAMDKYGGHRGGMKDRGFWLSAYNGGSYTVDRISRGSTLIPNLSASILGGIQPDTIRQLADEGVDDGLLQRFVTIVLRSSSVGHDRPKPDVVKEYEQLIRTLHEMRPPTFGLLYFDTRAQAIRRQLDQTHHEWQLAYETINKKLASHIGKYNDLFARLCIIWHCIENAEESATKALPNLVSDRTARRVANFLHTFLLPHSRAFYKNVLGLSDDNERLVAVAGYILTHKLTQITARDIARGDRSMRRLTKWDTDRIFQQLHALSWGSIKQTSRVDNVVFTVGPRVHVLYAQRAEEERKRRQRVQQIIAEDTCRDSKP
jgi:uncharacterized protein DUF3987